jgi:hypothetical protein
MMSVISVMMSGHQRHSSCISAHLLSQRDRFRSDVCAQRRTQRLRKREQLKFRPRATGTQGGNEPDGGDDGLGRGRLVSSRGRDGGGWRAVVSAVWFGSGSGGSGSGAGGRHDGEKSLIGAFT